MFLLYTLFLFDYRSFPDTLRAARSGCKVCIPSCVLWLILCDRITYQLFPPYWAQATTLIHHHYCITLDTITGRAHTYHARSQPSTAAAFPLFHSPSLPSLSSAWSHHPDRPSCRPMLTRPLLLRIHHQPNHLPLKRPRRLSLPLSLLPLPLPRSPRRPRTPRRRPRRHPRPHLPTPLSRPVTVVARPPTQTMAVAVRVHPETRVVVEVNSLRHKTQEAAEAATLPRLRHRLVAATTTMAAVASRRTAVSSLRTTAAASRLARRATTAALAAMATATTAATVVRRPPALRPIRATSEFRLAREQKLTCAGSRRARTPRALRSS